MPFGLDKHRFMPHTRYINKTKWLARHLTKGSKTMNAPLIGETFTTAQSGVTGVVQEVVKNASGTYRVRLDVNGQERWTTVK